MYRLDTSLYHNDNNDTENDNDNDNDTVSYTHLTLPTKRIV